MDPDSYRGAMLREAAAADPAAAAGDEASGAPEPEEDVKAWEYIRTPCLGLLPGLCCPHHDRVQSNGKLRALDFDAMMLRHPNEHGLARRLPSPPLRPPTHTRAQAQAQARWAACY